MRKLKLELNDLRVESFAPAQRPWHAGTVRGEQDTFVPTNCEENCPYTGFETSLCTCNTNEFYCESSECPHTGVHDCGHYSRIEPEACPADTGKNCTANGCWSGVC